jgi:hypothetical protein
MNLALLNEIGEVVTLVNHDGRAYPLPEGWRFEDPAKVSIETMQRYYARSQEQAPPATVPAAGDADLAQRLAALEEKTRHLEVILARLGVKP